MAIDWKATLARIRRRLVRRGTPEQLAEDLVHESWLRMARYERNHVVEEPEAFMTVTAINLSIDERRARQRHGEQCLDDDAPLVDGAPNVEDLVLARERAAICIRCLEAMDDRTRQIFFASRMEGMTYPDIARAHGLSVSSVEKVIARAMVVLLRAMDGHER